MKEGSLLSLVVVGAILFGCALLLYRNVLHRLGKNRSLILVLMRCGVLLIFAIFLVKPDFTCRSLPFKSTLSVIVDKSRSMSLTDCPGGKSRLETALLLWLGQLKRVVSERFEVQEFVLDAKVQTRRLDGKEKLTPDGEESNIIAGLEKVAKGAESIFLFSAGRATSAASKRFQLPKDFPPVFCVGLGTTNIRGLKDISLRLESVPQTVHLKTSFNIALKISSSGFGKILLPLTLYENGKMVLTQQVELHEGENIVNVAYAPQSTGLHRYKINLPEREEELLKENNETGFYLQVVESRIPVFYAEGVPRWEYKFTKQVISEDPNIEFVGCVRVGAEDFVLQGLKEKTRVKGALPADESEMKKFKILIVGDISRSLVSEEQLAMIERFVSEGGTLIVIGGENVLSAEYRGSPLEALLPVRLEGALQKVTAPFLPSLTSEGKHHPIFENYQEYFETSGQNTATVDTLYVAGAQKAGAVTLAVNPTILVGGKPAPLVVLQNYGAGKVILVSSDTLWRWYFRYRTLGLQSPYVRFYGQMLRWATEVEEETHAPLLLRLSAKFLKTKESLSVDVEPRGEVVPESVECWLKKEDGTPKYRVTLTSSGEGVFSGVVSVEESGRYGVVAEGVTRNGARVEVKTPIIVGDPYAEYRDLSLDDKFLKQIAAQTRGGYFKITEMDKLLRDVVAMSENIAASAERPFWQHPALFLLLVGLLGGEYILRKRRGFV
ncbi:MAG: hypothetical protein N2234_01360 [Planctomycetota bacterium]|nr:hypothetical protein [Planctomycetota bacterium]